MAIVCIHVNWCAVIISIYRDVNQPIFFLIKLTVEKGRFGRKSGPRFVSF